MKSRIPVIACSAVACVLLAERLTLAAAQSQSLADVARQEEERRKEVKAPAKVYTNQDLRPGRSATLPAAEGAQPAAPGTAATPPAAAGDKEKAGEGAAGAPKEGAAAAPKEGAVVKDQAYWSKRMAGLRVNLDRDQTYADAMQVKIDALTRDFSARDDPAQRTKIQAERTKALSELDRLKTTVQSDKKAIADLEEEARRASVPAGWLR